MAYYFLLRLRPLWDESSKHRLSHLDTPSHMHFNHQEGVFPTSFFIHLSERKHLMLTAHQHRQYIIYFDSYVQGKYVHCWHALHQLYLYSNIPHISLAHVQMTKVWFSFLLKVVDWTFEDALTTIQSLPSIPTSVLQSADGTSLGGYMLCEDPHYPADVCHVSLTILKKWLENGSFNPEHMVRGWLQLFYGYIAHIVSRLLVQWYRECGYWVDCLPLHKAPLGQISSIPHLIKYVCSLLEFKRTVCRPPYMQDILYDHG